MYYNYYKRFNDKILFGVSSIAAKKKKPNPIPQIPRDKSISIPKLESVIGECICFSFKHLITPKDYQLSKDTISFDKWVSRLKHHSSQTVREFRSDYSKTTNNHKGLNPKIVEAMDMRNLPTDIEDSDLFQFSLGGLSRANGFFIQNIFIIRLINTDHKIK